MVLDRPRVIRQHFIGVVDLTIIQNPTHEIGLPTQEVLRQLPREYRCCPPVHMLAIQHPLGLQELPIEGRNR